MSDQFKWEGNVLRGPVKLLVGNAVDLPRGPPESAPFNTGKWSLQFEKQDMGWRLRDYWTRDVIRASDLKYDWKVTNSDDSPVPPPATGTKKTGPLLANPEWTSSYTTTPQTWNIEDHAEANSEFKMTVSCPSLLDKPDEPSAAAAASFAFGQSNHEM